MNISPLVQYCTDSRSTSLESSDKDLLVTKNTSGYHSLQPHYYGFSNNGSSDSNAAVVSPPLTPVISSSVDLFDGSSNDSRNDRADFYYTNSGMKSIQQQLPQHKHSCHLDFCGWSFKRYEHLKRHMLVHTGERPHTCQFPGCGKSFSRSDNFHAHYRTHAKKKKCTTKKSAAVTTVVTSSAAVTSRVTKTQEDNPSNSFSFAANQFNQLPTIANKNVASTVAATAAVVAVSQQQNNDQVFYNAPSSLCNIADGNFLSSNVTNEINIYDNSCFDSTNYSLVSKPMLSYGSMMNSPSPSPSPTFKSGYSPSLSSIDLELLPHIPFFSSSTSHNNHIYANSYNDTYTPNSYRSRNNSEVTIYGGTYQQEEFRNKSRSRKLTKLNHTTSSPLSKLHACPISQCQRQFKRLEHLKRHMRIHTHEKPFHCSYPICHKKFSRSDNLSQHIRTHQKRMHEIKRK